MGFAGQSVKCPAAAFGLAATCTAYAQGGSLVTGDIGYNHANGFLTVPLKKQIANHLANPTFGGSFKSTDLILLEGGLNEVFLAMYGDGTPQNPGLVAIALQAQADALAGTITADQAKQTVFGAQTAAQGLMKQAALDLASYIKSDILGKGGKYVVVLNDVDLSLVPEGAAAPAEFKSVLTGLTETFNLWLRDGLTDQPVQIIDAAAFLKDAVTNPATYGFANVSMPACDAAKISAITAGAVTSGTSLFCNATPGAPFNGLATGADANTWLFADGNHPTTGGHKALSQLVLDQLKAFGWI